MSRDAPQPEGAAEERPRQPRQRAIASAELALSLAELLRVLEERLQLADFVVPSQAPLAPPRSPTS